MPRRTCGFSSLALPLAECVLVTAKRGVAVLALPQRGVLTRPGRHALATGGRRLLLCFCL